MNYDIHEQKLLAIIACMKECNVELRGLAKPLTILTDNMNLKYFLTTESNRKTDTIDTIHV